MHKYNVFTQLSLTFFSSNSRNTAEVSMQASVTPTYQYTVKASNPNCKADFCMRKLDATSAFTSFDAIKQKLNTTLQAPVSNLGYTCIRPGHGWKGRQELIDNDTDVKEMYAVYGKKTSILLWCHLFSTKKQPCKRPNEPKDMASAPSSKRNACMQKITEVEEIVSDLQQRHGSEYSVEKLNAWAHNYDSHGQA